MFLFWRRGLSMNNHSLFSRRLGKFSIDRDYIDTHPDTVQQILSTVIVVRAEMMWDMDRIEYIGISHSFEALSCGGKTPWYLPKVDSNDCFQKWIKE